MAAVRCGQSQRAVARRFGVGLSHWQYWLARTRSQQLERVDGADQSHAPRQQGRPTNVHGQRRVLAWRQELRPGDLGFGSAQAMAEALHAGNTKGQPPSRRTSGRMLKRHGALAAVRRVRRTAPPAGWYLPDVAAGTAELDAFDVIEDRHLEAGPRLDVLTTRALWGAVCGAWGSAARRSRWLCERLTAHWRQHGCPLYALFDHDARFQGTHTHPDVLGQVIAFASRWASRPSLPRHGNRGRKISMRASTICGSSRSGRAFTTPGSRPARPPVTGSWPLTGRAGPRAMTRPRRAAPFPNAGSWICQHDPVAPSFTCAAPTLKGRSRCWAIGGPWIGSGSPVGARRSGFGGQSNPLLPPAPARTGGSAIGQNFPICVSAQAHSSRLTNIRWHLPAKP